MYPPRLSEELELGFGFGFGFEQYSASAPWICFLTLTWTIVSYPTTPFTHRPVTTGSTISCTAFHVLISHHAIVLFNSAFPNLVQPNSCSQNAGKICLNGQNEDSISSRNTECKSS